MWHYLTPEMHDEVLLSLKLVNDTDVKKVKRTLYSISNNIVKNYKEFNIKKKNGKSRKICEPSESLKKVQRNILHNVLEEKRLSKYAKAYRQGVGLKDNASVHLGKKLVLKLDIKDFFNNVTFMKVYESCFPESLYPRDIGMLLTNLCTYEEKLPQGAPTSSYISNVVMREFDEVVGKYCDKLQVSYTRYSDDMTFSGDFDPKEIIIYVSNLLKKMGFIINRDKIVVIASGNRQMVTGVVVNKKAQVSKKTRKKIRQEVHYVLKYGTESHLRKINLSADKQKYLNVLLGKINFVLQINNDDKEFQNYRKAIYNLIIKGKVNNEIR